MCEDRSTHIVTLPYLTPFSLVKLSLFQQAIKKKLPGKQEFYLKPTSSHYICLL